MKPNDALEFAKSLIYMADNNYHLQKWQKTQEKQQNNFSEKIIKNSLM